ncbi:MAG: primosomal protein N' [Alphaproteobacteria bacterium]|nr:primosomal protein N' [Alphaproteobacteria bacterium]
MVINSSDLKSYKTNTFAIWVAGAKLPSYTYIADSDIALGSVVEVPLRNRKVLGIVMEKIVLVEKPSFKLKSINRVIKENFFTEDTRKFIIKAQKYLLTTPGQFVFAVLSSSMKIVEGLPDETVLKNFYRVNVKSSVDILKVDETNGEDDKTVKRILKKVSTRRIISMIQKQKNYPLGYQIALQTKANVKDIIALELSGILCKMDTGELMTPTDVNLNLEQKSALDNILENGDNFKVHLLKGLTGSGKTEVYFELIEEKIRQKKQVLIMLPEISLTAVFLQRFEKKFGFAPFIFHSLITENNKKLILQVALLGIPCVVIGTRSSLWIPFHNLGLIVVDEEHDSNSYKQDEGLFYNARDMAVLRSSFEDIPVLLVSATPSLETINNVKQKRYKSVILPSRFGNARLPEIIVVDKNSVEMKALKQHNKSSLNLMTPEVIIAIEKQLEKNEQTLIFLNRRGYSPVIKCKSCEHIPSCEDCQVALVSHKKKNILLCHYCGREYKNLKNCPKCNANEFSNVGVGVERCGEFINEIFPDAKTLLASSDTMSSNKTSEDIINSIINQDVDIIVGTQIISKGFHFPNLTLVVVIDIEGELVGVDFRARERLFQTLTQISGRAGREDKVGKVIIQTLQTQHPLLEFLKDNDDDGFYTQELDLRRRAEMPPFTKLVGIIFESKNLESIENFMDKVSAVIRKYNNKFNFDIMGPIPAPMFKVRNWFRFRCLIRLDIKQNHKKATAEFLKAIGTQNDCNIKVDVNPLNFS